MKYTYIELLDGLDACLADYGNRDLEYPDHINPEADLTEDQAKEVFNFNDGDVDAIIEYLEGDE